MEIKTRSRVVILSGILYLLAGCFLITTAGLFTGVIMHQYAYDGKYGPRNGHAISKLNFDHFVSVPSVISVVICVSKIDF